MFLPSHLCRRISNSRLPPAPLFASHFILQANQTAPKMKWENKQLEKQTMRSNSLTTFAPNIYIKEYPIRYAGCSFYSRMTIVKLSKGQLWIHSPCDIDQDLKSEIEELGSVSTIIAPGNYHHLHVASCQAAFPKAKTYISPGVETKQPKLKYDAILDESKPEDLYAADFEQILLQGNRVINEVAFYHKPTKTLILVDSIEWIGDHTPGTNWVLRLWWKYLLRMWNVAKPAPEYQMGWNDKVLAKKCMLEILDWDFDSVIISHGENITSDAKQVVKSAWKGIIG